MFDQTRAHAPLKSEKRHHKGVTETEVKIKNRFSVKTTMKYKVLMCLA